MLRRLGVHAPLTSALLRDAARGYSVFGDDASFTTALNEITCADAPAHRSPVLLLSIRDERNAVIGYTVADYLLQRSVQQRRSVPVPVVTWDALLTHIHVRDDRIRLADNAKRRNQYGARHLDTASAGCRG